MTGGQIFAIVIVAFALWVFYLYQCGCFYEEVIWKLDRQRHEFARIALALEKLARGEKPDA